MPETLDEPRIRNTAPNEDHRSATELAAWPEVSELVREALETRGHHVDFEAGHCFFEVGDENSKFIYLERGVIDVLDRLDDHVVGRVEAGGFVGELGLLMGQRTFLAAEGKAAGRALIVERDDLLLLVQTVPEVADCVVGAFAARRRLLIENNEGGLTIVGSEDDPGAVRLLEFVGRNGIPHRFVDRTDASELDDLRAACSLPDEGTAVVTADGRLLCDPEPCDLARRLGLDLGVAAEETFDVAIVGAGPGGLAAAVYAASEGLRTVIVEDTAIGGQAGTSSKIENYLGFPGGISGGDLAFRAQVQAVKFGARIAAPRRATRLERDGDAWCLRLENEEDVRARAIVLACGVQWRRLPLARLAHFEGRGVYYAATELEARFCRDTNAVIVGGGNSAGQAAMFMSRYAACTYVVVRGDGLAETMSAYLADRIASDERIELLTHTEVVELRGEGHLEEVVLEGNETGERQTLGCRAMFSMIGAEPNTRWLEGAVALDDHGFVLTGHEVGAHGMATSAEGVFAVGDLRAGSVKRVASAVGEGSVVVSAIHGYLADHGS